MGCLALASISFFFNYKAHIFLLPAFNCKLLEIGDESESVWGALSYPSIKH